MNLDQFKPGSYYYVWNKDYATGELDKAEPYVIVRIHVQEPYTNHKGKKFPAKTWVIYPDEYDGRTCPIEQFDRTLVIGMVPRPKLHD